MDAAAFEARCLVRAAGSATLATAAGGQPFASLVTPAAAPDLAVLLWLSALSEHTRQLRAEPRCALLFTGAATGPNPQTTPRVTLTGLAEPVPDAEAPPLKARWLSRHPYAALYAGFADFGLWRVRPRSALLVGGFARATRLARAALLPDPAAVAAIAAAEAGIVAHVNADHAGAVALIAERLLGAPPGPWRLAGVDPDGCDLALPDGTPEGSEAGGGASEAGGAEEGGAAPTGLVARLAFAAPVATAAGVREALVRAVRQARGEPTES
ncbi:pyridoxamine 5'-phosphate oxidase family protein [Roseomonas sp. NAR14]|uniref:Pyridoxamine 5'-phosphate oxidase family protein n=1 Tax=Roseomonas acroporae TaxID=2937791 RepID=A0A9X2BU73_9PROT|nr:DUF2470 domain-containing protein [Roseomonas acroporae]MCK8785187.1 pyridoxamine 5'-phosphate oxidase family protein [Roseomonas acroporae]